LVNEEVEVFLRGAAAMVPTIRAHIQGPNEPVLDVDMAALVALLPRVGWDLQLDPLRRARFALFLEPGHARHSGGVEGDNLGAGPGRRQSRVRNSLSEFSIPGLARFPRAPSRHPQR